MKHRLDNCAERINDHVTPKDVHPNMPYIGLEHINENSLSLNGYSKAKDANSGKLLFKKGDILFGKLRPYFRKLIIAPFDGICSTDIWVIRPKNNFDRNFLFYWLSSDEVINTATNTSEGTKMPRAKWEAIKNIEIPRQENEQLKCVGNILATLDKKIELNNKINQTLESIAQAIFKSWFIDFDPVHAKVKAIKEGRNPELAAMEAIAGKSASVIPANAGIQELPSLNLLNTEDLRRIASLFPSEFVESELGMIPKGWEISDICRYFNLTMGQSPPGSTYNELGLGLSFFQGVRDFGFRFPVNRIYCTQPQRIANQGDTLISVRAPVGQINMAFQECCIGRGVAAIRHKSGSRSYTYYCINNASGSFKNYDSGTVFESINKSNFEKFIIFEPDISLIKLFEEIIYPIDQKIESNVMQSQNISSIRDKLLPKLISGEILNKRSNHEKLTG